MTMKMRRISMTKRMSSRATRILGSMTHARFFGCLRSVALGSLSLFLALGIAVAGEVASPAMAQVRSAARAVQGKVVDKGDAPLKGAVVYLKDDHSLAVKSFITDGGGTFRFAQLSQSTDYELWAELDGKKSKTRTISSFDNKNEFVMDLKIDTGK
jgi:hypothetical protein